MSLNANDLIRIAKLIKLAADTARAFCDETPLDGKSSAIVDAVKRIDAAADDLVVAGIELGKREGPYQINGDVVD